MKHPESIKSRTKTLKREITALYYAYRDPALPMLPKLLILFTVAYALSPVDLIPDFIPILGYLDDLLILPALISLSLKLIPKEIMDASRLRAEKEAPRLKKNWAFAILFVLVWFLLLAALASALIKLFER